jgi:hypothetical protein
LARLRILSGKQVCIVLARHGFEEVRRRGSHIEKSFDRDIDGAKDKKVLRKLRDLLSTIENADSIQGIPHAKKLEGCYPTDLEFGTER